ncbi:DinB family protein [Deinococcus budaensis]|uniref:Putative damage-inducible protein DinB n=1 Tax=Deinococcus budaensis TaxID=1665626 RepID=A0A7W8GF65_9DEIO|nr:DinB family protein [Deinococcus budaensis]MBB5234521.1 putative damage-inducible protein DinB [Deinococcus budaensis]
MMDIPGTYAYLVRARRDLWATLEAVPDEVLSRPLLRGERFHSIKDLVAHTARVEDGWIHHTILRDAPVEDAFPAIQAAGDGPVYAGFPLAELLAYWRAVEASTLAYLATLTGDDLARVVEDTPEEHFRLDGLLWHVMLHEVRHTAQIAALLRTQGLRPPSLDLLFYLPNLRQS